MGVLTHPALKTSHLLLPGYLRTRLGAGSVRSVTRIWVAFTDHFEPWWHRPDTATALERVARWVDGWPEIAARHTDSAGRPPCYTFFYPEEQYHPEAIDGLRALCDRGIGDVEVHLHHDNDTPQAFDETLLDRLSAVGSVTAYRPFHSGHALIVDFAEPSAVPVTLASLARRPGASGHAPAFAPDAPATKPGPGCITVAPARGW